VSEFKYLGILFSRSTILEFDITPVKRKFYAACNSILQKAGNSAVPIKMHLIKSYCLPLLTYCLGALELSVKAIHDLSVCWNDAFRKIFKYQRWESVKQLQYYCGELDFKHMYDLLRWEFLVNEGSRFVCSSMFVSALESQFHDIHKLKMRYSAVIDGCLNYDFKLVIFDHFAKLASGQTLL
jgi:hypothetical protein